ncbi:MAG: hypothetical protein ACI8W0_000763 [Flavobacterium sp.]
MKPYKMVNCMRSCLEIVSNEKSEIACKTLKIGFDPPHCDSEIIIIIIYW